jgi:hypothetical protein
MKRQSRTSYLCVRFNKKKYSKETRNYEVEILRVCIGFIFLALEHIYITFCTGAN